MTTPIAQLKEAAEKATPGPWEYDAEKQTDAPYKHSEFALFTAKGERICGTENSDYRLGLIETEFDEDGARCWNEPSRRNMEFIALANPSTILPLIAALEAAEAKADKYEKALTWYANPEIYKPHPHGAAFDNRDLSYTAKSALGDTP